MPCQTDDMNLLNGLVCSGGEKFIASSSFIFLGFCWDCFILHIVSTLKSFVLLDVSVIFTTHFRLMVAIHFKLIAFSYASFLVQTMWNHYINAACGTKLLTIFSTILADWLKMCTRGLCLPDLKQRKNAKNENWSMPILSKDCFNECRI